MRQRCLGVTPDRTHGRDGRSIRPALPVMAFGRMTPLILGLDRGVLRPLYSRGGASIRSAPPRLLYLSARGLSIADGEVLDTAGRGGADIVPVTGVDDLPPPLAGVAGVEGGVGRVVGAVAVDGHLLREGGCAGAGGVSRAEQVEGDRAARIRRGAADGGVVVRDEVLSGTHLGGIRADHEFLAGAGAGGAVVVGVAAVHRLPEERASLVEGDRVGIRHL